MISKEQKKKLKTLISHYRREYARLQWIGSYEPCTHDELINKARIAEKKLNNFIDSITEEICK